MHHNQRGSCYEATFIALGIVFFCSSAFISASALADEVKQEAEKLAVAYTDCVAKKDAACVAALYTKDGVQINPGGVFSDLKTVYENNFKNGTDHIEIRVGNMSVINNDLVVANGETDIFGKDPKSGDATKVTVFWGAIEIREGGALKIRQLTVGMKPPPAKEANAEKK
ncbi:nuclear transport factor 2 family protein [Bradyrhizobium sp. CB1015]|uniref:nuclear transport factor 2 family protein n=1 Tax=Bradyrhizobium sp. CB1015 TaxID=2976822 RepID=UPI0021AA6805|nr:nuclear transport factor 2 family protein [Bradyrhizobium sp. CB1015]UWU94261.1 nuclear transport factor 2 family protein [Bradyrhizobium sp. CB1015]